jgi:hypothetical protein
MAPAARERRPLLLLPLLVLPQVKFIVRGGADRMETL